MFQTIESLNYARLCFLSGNQEEGYVTLVEVIDKLTTEQIKKESVTANQLN